MAKQGRIDDCLLIIVHKLNSHRKSLSSLFRSLSLLSFSSLSLRFFIIITTTTIIIFYLTGHYFIIYAFIIINNNETRRRKKNSLIDLKANKA